MGRPRIGVGPRRNCVVLMVCAPLIASSVGCSLLRPHANRAECRSMNERVSTGGTYGKPLSLSIPEDGLLLSEAVEASLRRGVAGSPTIFYAPTPAQPERQQSPTATRPTIPADEVVEQVAELLGGSYSELLHGDRRQATAYRADVATILGDVECTPLPDETASRWVGGMDSRFTRGLARFFANPRTLKQFQATDSLKAREPVTNPASSGSISTHQQQRLADAVGAIARVVASEADASIPATTQPSAKASQTIAEAWPLAVSLRTNMTDSSELADRLPIRLNALLREEGWLEDDRLRDAFAHYLAEAIQQSSFSPTNKITGSELDQLQRQLARLLDALPEAHASVRDSDRFSTTRGEVEEREAEEGTGASSRTTGNANAASDQRSTRAADSLAARSQPSTINASHASVEQMPIVMLKRGGSVDRLIPLPLVNSSPAGDIMLHPGDRIEIIPVARTPLARRNATSSDSQQGVVAISGVVTTAAPISKVTYLHQLPDCLAANRVELTSATDLQLVRIRHGDDIGEYWLPLPRGQFAHLADPTLAKAPLASGDWIELTVLELSPLVRASQLQRRLGQFDLAAERCFGDHTPGSQTTDSQSIGGHLNGLHPTRIWNSAVASVRSMLTRPAVR